MKYLYLQFLRLRVWILRRRLRQMGFREAANRTSPEILVRLEKVQPPASVRLLHWLRIVLLVAGILIWLLCFLRLGEASGRGGLPAKAPSNLPHPQARPATNLTLHRYTA